MLDSRKLLLTLAATITGIYLIILLILFSPIHELLLFLTNAPFNERGDFLAGVFGPIAFAWLVVGYFMQSHEFKLQREELLRQAQRDDISISLELRKSDPKVHIATDGKRKDLIVKFLDNNPATQLAVHIRDKISEEGKIIGILDRIEKGFVWSINLRESDILLSAKRHYLLLSYFSVLSGQRVQEFELVNSGRDLLILHNGIAYSPP